MAGSGRVLLQTDLGVDDVTPFVQRFTYKNSLLTGCTRWKLAFETPRWDYWKKIMIGQGLSFRLQVSGTRDGRSETTPWLPLEVDLSDGDLEGVRLAGAIVGGGTELRMMTRDRRRAFTNTTAAAVLQKIAAEYSLAPDVPASSEVDNWYQVNETDWAFVNDVLEEYLPSKNSRGDAFLNVSDGKLSVTTINYSAPSVRKYDLTTHDDRVPRVRFRYYGGQVARRGVVVEARGFDRTTGLAVTHTATPQTAFGAALADRLPQAIADKRKVIVMETGSLASVRTAAVREQARNARRYFGVEITVLNDLSIRLGDMIEIAMKDTKGSGAFTEGRYGVFEYYNVYTPGSIYSKVVGYRQESFVGPVPATGAPASVSSGTDKYRAGRSNFQTVTKTAQPTGV